MRVSRIQILFSGVGVKGAGHKPHRGPEHLFARQRSLNGSTYAGMINLAPESLSSKPKP